MQQTPYGDDIHIQTQQFLTAQWSLRFFLPLDQAHLVTYRLLSGMLSVKNQAYPTAAAWNAHLEGLYHLQLGSRLSPFQDRFEFSFRMRHVPPEMVQKADVLDGALSAFNTMLTAPLLDAKSLAQEKRFLKEEWATKKASKTFQAIRHLSEKILSDHPYFTPQVMDDAAIDAVDLTHIHEAYTRLMHAPRVLIRLGQTPSEAGLQFLKPLPEMREPLSLSPVIQHAYKEVVIDPVKDAMKQTLMYDVYDTHLTRDDADFEGLMVLNQLLGGDSESMLFKTIRERYNMAYSVGSTLLSQYGLLLINGAISPTNQPAYLAEVSAILSQIQSGDYSNDALALAKQSQIETIKRNHDAKVALVRRAFFSVYLEEAFDKTAMIARLHAIQKSDITRVATRLNRVTSFQYGATL